MRCRIYLNQPLEGLSSADIHQEQAYYLKQVMRLQVGDEIIVFNGEGGEFNATLTSLAKDGGQCMLEEKLAVNRELPCKVHIIQAANRSDKIETVLQKATEMGASSFQVFNSERATLKLPNHKRDKRLQRWQKIVEEAAEQSERTAMPTVVWVDKMEGLMQQGQCFVLHPRDAVLWQDVRDKMVSFEAITLAIGPEGGWSKQELQVLQEKGFQPMMFGQRVMRTETAAPALLAAIQAVV